MVLKLISVGQDSYEEDIYPSYHVMQVGKAESFSSTTVRQKKNLCNLKKKIFVIGEL